MAHRKCRGFVLVLLYKFRGGDSLLGVSFHFFFGFHKSNLIISHPSLSLSILRTAACFLWSWPPIPTRMFPPRRRQVGQQQNLRHHLGLLLQTHQEEKLLLLHLNLAFLQTPLISLPCLAYSMTRVLKN
ncbi:hypothetical protein QYF36_014364 [Acer negundo]|nr:hypothetical protein QYF36_014364 [Acer negundo]